MDPIATEPVLCTRLQVWMVPNPNPRLQVWMDHVLSTVGGGKVLVAKTAANSPKGGHIVVACIPANPEKGKARHHCSTYVQSVCM